MNEHQVDVAKIVESLLRQVSDYAQKVALLEAFIASKEAESGNEKAD